MPFYSDQHQAMRKQLDELVVAGDAERLAFEVVRFDLQLGDVVTTPEGHALVEEDTDQYLFRFEVGLGPVNAAKLLVFLRELPDEPDEEGG